MTETGIIIDELGGNCPVQAEGTFDGVPFYFRARGTSVTCDVGDDDWEWCGPEYEWPSAGYISEDTARAFICEAYAAWKSRERDKSRQFRMYYRRTNGLMEEAMVAMGLALHAKEAGNEAVETFLTQYAQKVLDKRSALLNERFADPSPREKNE